MKLCVSFKFQTYTSGFHAQLTCDLGADPISRDFLYLIWPLIGMGSPRRN